MLVCNTKYDSILFKSNGDTECFAEKSSKSWPTNQAEYQPQQTPSYKFKRLTCSLAMRRVAARLALQSSRQATITFLAI